MSSIAAIIGAVVRAIDRAGLRSEIRSTSVKQFEEALLHEAADLGGPTFEWALFLAIQDLWNKPRRITVDEKKKRQGHLRELLSVITPHDTPIEMAIEEAPCPTCGATGLPQCRTVGCPDFAS